MRSKKTPAIERVDSVYGTHVSIPGVNFGKALAETYRDEIQARTLQIKLLEPEKIKPSSILFEYLEEQGFEIGIRDKRTDGKRLAISLDVNDLRFKLGDGERERLNIVSIDHDDHFSLYLNYGAKQPTQLRFGGDLEKTKDFIDLIWQIEELVDKYGNAKSDLYLESTQTFRWKLCFKNTSQIIKIDLDTREFTILVREESRHVEKVQIEDLEDYVISKRPTPELSST